jgi:hypothetical protein
MTRDRAMGKIDCDAGSKRRGRSEGRCSASKVEGGKVWYNRYSFLKLRRRPISEVLETKKALPPNLRGLAASTPSLDIAADDELAVAAEGGRIV